MRKHIFRSKERTNGSAGTGDKNDVMYFQISQMWNHKMESY